MWMLECDDEMSSYGCDDVTRQTPQVTIPPRGKVDRSRTRYTHRFTRSFSAHVHARTFILLFFPFHSFPFQTARVSVYRVMWKLRRQMHWGRA